MKRIISTLCALVMAAGLSFGCDNNETPRKDEETPKIVKSITRKHEEKEYKIEVHEKNCESSDAIYATVQGGEKPVFVMYFNSVDYTMILVYSLNDYFHGSKEDITVDDIDRLSLVDGFDKKR